MYLVRIEILCLNIFFGFVLLTMLFLNDILNFENARSFYFVSYYYTFKVLFALVGARNYFSISSLDIATYIDPIFFLLNIKYRSLICYIGTKLVITLTVDF